MENRQGAEPRRSRPLCRQDISRNSNFKGAHVAFTIFFETLRRLNIILLVYSPRRQKAGMSRYLFICKQNVNLSWFFLPEILISIHENAPRHEIELVDPQSRGSSSFPTFQSLRPFRKLSIIRKKYSSYL